jgi:exopolyphosphatase/guanosine-5'-triphosphate,3'-diphosphate pyrophosphatase
VAIIDIGSNSIRLMVYDGLARSPVALFNEKSVCALGQGLANTGRLNALGMAEALPVIERFVRLARAMDVRGLDVLATAAVRDARDGQQFVEQIEYRCGVSVTVLSGEEEARLSAMGVLCSTPDAQGTVADLGGGSIELVAVDHGRLASAPVSLPLGVLRLAEVAEGDRAKAADLVDLHFATVDWLGQGRGQAFYAVGGAWRAVARLCIAQTGHPLHVLDNYTLGRSEALGLLDLIARQSRRSMEKIPNLSKRRVPHLPMAALLLEKVLEKVQPATLVFSVYGLREGRFYDYLPDDVRAQDPLIASCLALARRYGRFAEHGDELMDWMAPLFVNETARQARLRHAVCLLGDIFWSEHPDYRAEQAFLRVFRLPLVGLGHRDRAALALAVHARYEDDGDTVQVEAARNLLSEDDYRRVRVIGLALRLGHYLSGGVPGLLRTTRLRSQGGILSLDVPADNPIFGVSATDRRCERLAKAAGLGRVEINRV